MRTYKEVMSEMKKINLDPTSLQKEIESLESELMLFLAKEAYEDEDR